MQNSDWSFITRELENGVETGVRRLGVTLNVTGASLRKPIDWHHIVWSKAYRNVHRLQVRIVKAFQEGKIRKARALQIILTRSLGGKALAVRGLGMATSPGYPTYESLRQGSQLYQDVDPGFRITSR